MALLAVLLALAAGPSALPRAGIAVESRGAVVLLDLAGRARRTLPGWRIDGSPAAPPGTVLLRDRRGARWQLDRRGLRRARSVDLGPSTLAFGRGGWTLALRDGRRVRLPSGGIASFDDAGGVFSVARPAGTVAVDVASGRRVAVRRGCFLAARRPAYRLEVCGYPVTRGDSSRIVRVDARGRGVVSGPAHPDVQGRPDGWWRSVAVGPRGTLLAQWSGECEVPEAYLGPPLRPAARTAAGDAAESVALGWVGTRALVALPVGACGGGYRLPGVYLGGTRIAPLGERDAVAFFG